MKKHVRIFALVLTLSMMLLTACGGKKTYSTVEEWYDDNPALRTFINAGIDNAEEDGDDLAMIVEDNTLIYSVKLEEKMFGESEEMDATYKAFFDESFEAEKEEYVSIIPDLADMSGVPESSISIRIEIYNPGETTPSYTKTFAQ